MKPETLQKLIPLLSPRHSGPVSLTPLTGGLINLVWRAQTPSGTLIAKYAPPHAAAAPDLPMNPDRLRFEARALALLGAGGPLENLCSGVRVPKLFAYHPPENLLLLEDFGPEAENLDIWLTLGSGDPAVIGARFGVFLAGLHRRTSVIEGLAEEMNNLPIQEARFRRQYSSVEAWCRIGGCPESVAQTVGERLRALGEVFLQPGRCLIMGDAWLRSLLIMSEELGVIDWEFSHFGRPAQDVGHLLAHLWMQAFAIEQAIAPPKATFIPVPNALARIRDWTAAFVAAYRKNIGVFFTDRDSEDTSHHMGAEILARTVGSWRNGYLFADLPTDSPVVKKAVDFATRAVLSGESEWSDSWSFLRVG